MIIKNFIQLVILILLLISNVFAYTWQDYIDKQLKATKLFSDAAIVGNSDGVVFSQFGNFNLFDDEIQKTIFLNHSFDYTYLMLNKLVLYKTKWQYFCGQDNISRFQNGKIGLILFKTIQTVIIGRFEDITYPGSAYDAVEKLGHILISSGY